MKAYFIQLFNYDLYANLRILETILQAGEPEKPVQLMAHLLAAQQVWITRCKGEPLVARMLWPDWKADTFEQKMNDSHRAWINFLDYLEPDDFDNMISYKDSKGNPFENKLSDILAHVINHGTHHRAQAGTYLKLAGIDLPILDLIFYIRGLGN
jgi:uncharacterized damage-inducible protein DinB